jgi:Fe-S oxidoreductase
MAGSFGYESEHYDISKAIGRILFDQVDESDGETVTAPGASCRSQLGDRGGETENPPHPIEKVAKAVTGPAADADISEVDMTRTAAADD